MYVCVCVYTCGDAHHADKQKLFGSLMLHGLLIESLKILQVYQ